jgi:sulfate transport system ATP-binding protein
MNEGRVEQVGTSDEVYQHPANAFVYSFLGNVNLFHARVEEGKAYLGDIPIDVPVETTEDGRTALVFVRPHLLEIDPISPPDGLDRFSAKVEHINAAGPIVKVDLMSEWGDPVHVELSHERYGMLGLKRDDTVKVRPKEGRVFIE